MCEAGTCPDCVCDACEDEIESLKEQLADAHRKLLRIPTDAEQQAFCEELEKIPGVLARRYDFTHRERFAVAGHAIHAWLSALDLSYQPAALRMTLAEFADAWARSRGPGLRRFRPSKAVTRWQDLLQQERNGIIDELRDSQVMSTTEIDIVCGLLEEMSEVP